MSGCLTQCVNRHSGHIRNNSNIDQIGPRPNLDSRTLAPLPKPSVVIKPCGGARFFIFDLDFCSVQTRLRLFRSGRRPVMLDRCSARNLCDEIGLDDGSVTWDVYPKAYAYRIRNGAPNKDHPHPPHAPTTAPTSSPRATS